MCLLGIVVILFLSALTHISVLSALTAAFSFCVLVSLYARFVPPEDLEISARPNPVRDRDISLQQQARIVDGFPEAVIIINHQERILYANAAAKSLLGISDLGGLFSGLIRNPSVQRLVTEVLGGQIPDPVIYDIDTPIERHIRVIGSPIAPDNDTNAETSDIKRAVIVFYDMTQMIHGNTMRADFLANASHELKTPIASLLGYIETLRGHARDDEKARDMFLGIMQEQAERMQRLINDLLSLRRIELLEHVIPTETADLFLASRAAIESVKPLAKSRNVKINYTGPKDAPVTGTQDELVQIILNLLDNALTVTPAYGKITLSIDLVPEWTFGQGFLNDPLFKDGAKRRIVTPENITGAYARLRLTDEGPGFAREHLPRLGERFYKIQEGETGRTRGTGLGLAIVKHIVRRHRGGLLIESAKDVGTVFTLLVPVPEDI